MTRKQYIEKLGNVLAAIDDLIELNSSIEADGLPNFTALEKKCRKSTNNAIESLHNKVFADAAISEREMREAAERGDAEQDELDFSGGAPAVDEAEPEPEINFQDRNEIAETLKEKKTKKAKKSSKAKGAK